MITQKVRFRCNICAGSLYVEAPATEQCNPLRYEAERVPMALAEHLLLEGYAHCTSCDHHFRVKRNNDPGYLHLTLYKV